MLGCLCPIGIINAGLFVSRLPSFLPAPLTALTGSFLPPHTIPFPGGRVLCSGRVLCGVLATQLGDPHVPLLPSILTALRATFLLLLLCPPPLPSTLFPCQVGECSAVWWRPNFETLMYPYCPPHITKPKVGCCMAIKVPKNFKFTPLLFRLLVTPHHSPSLLLTPRHSSLPLHPSSLLSIPFHSYTPHQEMKKLFVISLTERQYFGVPKNPKLRFQLISLHSSSLFLIPLHPSSFLSIPLHSPPLHQEMKKLCVVPLTKRQYFGVPKNPKLPFHLTPLDSPSLLSTPLNNSLTPLHSSPTGNEEAVCGSSNRAPVLWSSQESEAAGGATTGAV
ncbi:unnamed protein product [Closterium sp. NIES-54]